MPCPADIEPSPLVGLGQASAGCPDAAAYHPKFLKFPSLGHVFPLFAGPTSEAHGLEAAV